MNHKVKFIESIYKDHKDVIEQLSPDEKYRFQKLVEDMQLEATDEVTKAYKEEVAQKLADMFSKEAEQKREEWEKQEAVRKQERQADFERSTEVYNVLSKYGKPTRKDLEGIVAYEKLTGKKVLDTTTKTPSHDKGSFIERLNVNAQYVYSEMSEEEKQIIEKLPIDEVKQFEQLADDLVNNSTGKNGMNKVKTKVADYRLNQLLSSQEVINKYGKVNTDKTINKDKEVEPDK